MIQKELLPFTNKQARAIKYTYDTGYMYMDLFSFSNSKLSYFGIRCVFLLQ